MTIEPYPWERHLLIEWAVDEDTIPKYFQESVFTGIRKAASEGVPGLGPLVHLHVTVTGGSFHPVDSSEMDYRIAAECAFKDALSKTEVRSVVLSE